MSYAIVKFRIFLIKKNKRILIKYMIYFAVYQLHYYTFKHTQSLTKIPLNPDCPGSPSVASVWPYLDNQCFVALYRF